MYVCMYALCLFCLQNNIVSDFFLQANAVVFAYNDRTPSANVNETEGCCVKI